LRNKDRGEDFRYKNWRDSWGKYFYIRSYFQVYVLQGLLMFLISLSVVLSNLFYSEYSPVFLFIGLGVWLLGFFFETVGDYQLNKFVSNPENKGKIMKSGLWSITRHPNYFGEVTMWWGIFILCMPSVLWGVMLISPLAITFLILRVSGIPMLEKKYEGDPEFAEYKRRVSPFIPWFPRVK
jgi:steroid 5-alpha reductase family enzyme